MPATNLGTIVLDPGHGGTSTVGGSKANNATSISGVLEKDLTLDFCTRLRDLLKSQATAANESINVVLTRSTDVNVGIRDRAKTAKNNSAKLFLCIHFNGFHKPAVRGIETYFRAAANGNVNLGDDKDFATVVQRSLFSSMSAIDPQAIDRGVKPDTESGPHKLGVMEDADLGNNTLNPKCRAAYVEMEFITNNGVETTLVSGPSASANRTRVMSDLAKELRRYMGTF